MSSKYPIILASLFLSWILSSCEEPVDFDLDEETHLVVTSHFSENKALVVYVTESKSVLSNDNDFSYVENASISVFIGNEFIEIMELVADAHDRTTYYRTQNLNPVTGEIYTIKVNVPGYQAITATNYIPIPVPIDNVAFNPTIGKDSDDNTVINFDVTVTIQDPVEYDNFYHLFFFQELIPYTVSIEGDTILGDQVNRGTPIQINLSDSNFDAQKNYDNRSFLIEDSNFNGDLEIIGFNGNYTFDPRTYIAGDFIVELRTVSKEYYNYYSSINLSAANGGDPLNDSNVINDNIENGEGIFAGYSTSLNYSKLSD